MRVHSALPEALTAAADAALRGVEHVAHGSADAMSTAAGRAAALIAEAVRGGAQDRASLLAALRRLGPFDEHGDPLGPPAWLWRADADWTLEPERAL